MSEPAVLSFCWLTLYSYDWDQARLEAETGLSSNHPPRTRDPRARPRPFRGIVSLHSDREVSKAAPMEEHVAWMQARLVAARPGLARFEAGPGNDGRLFLCKQSEQDLSEGAADYFELPKELVKLAAEFGLRIDVKLELDHEPAADSIAWC